MPIAVHTAQTPVTDGDMAAIDLGSNSFHMVIARLVGGQLHVVDKVREPVRLAAGLQSDNTLDAESQERALNCLERLAERLRDIPNEQVRVVGTNTLRKARNSQAFLSRAKSVLGHNIEVLPGREEARLVYLGVAHSLVDEGHRLVIDIGGGSTECIVGERFQPKERDSLFMGCVSFSREFFPDGRMTKKRWEAAVVAAELELQSIQRRYREMGWDYCIGSSGTIKAVGEVLRNHGWSDSDITCAGLKRLRDAMLDVGHVDRLELEGLQADRQPVFPGGVSILAAVFKRLRIDSMQVSGGALREGLLYDLLGRIGHEDLRDHTVERLCDRYSVDRRQAVRVERSAMRLLEQVADIWQLRNGRPRQILCWASRLHEVGLAVNYAGYHKHGAYLVTNSDMPGFSYDDKRAVAAIICSHRRRITKAHFASLPAAIRTDTERLALLLRLAVLINRSRSTKPTPHPALRGKHKQAEIVLDKAWLERHPLTGAGLDREVDYLKAYGFQLRVFALPGIDPVSAE